MNHTCAYGNDTLYFDPKHAAKTLHISLTTCLPATLGLSRCLYQSKDIDSICICDIIKYIKSILYPHAFG